MHVHNRVSFVRYQQPVDILKDQTDGWRSLPSFLLALEVDFGKNSIGGWVVCASHEYCLILDIVCFSILNLETIVQFKNQAFVFNRIQNNFLDAIGLWYFIDTSFQADLILLVKYWFDLILGQTLVSISHGDHSFVVDCELNLLNITGMCQEIVPNIFLDAFNIFPDVDISIFIASNNEIAEITKGNRHHGSVCRFCNQWVLAQPRRPKALGDLFGLIHQLEVRWLQHQELSLICWDHNPWAIFREVDGHREPVLKFACC